MSLLEINLPEVIAGENDIFQVKNFITVIKVENAPEFQLEYEIVRIGNLTIALYTQDNHFKVLDYHRNWGFNFEIDINTFTIGNWKCRYSPIKVCIYNHKLDSIHDNCVICKQPEERK